MLKPSISDGKPIPLLLDNGSLRPEATLSLRRLAEALSEETGETVWPVSLLHSSKVDPDKLGGKPADTFVRFIKAMYEKGHSRFRVIPLFFGPSGALVDYLPEKIRSLRQTRPGLEVQIAPCLCPGDPSSDRLVVGMLADAVKATQRLEGLVKPRVALVDHGSPSPMVTQVRNRLALYLSNFLFGAVEQVAPCSMERREGPEFAFNEPLLARLLREPGWRDGPVIVAMLFLQPGKHAGMGGDIARICVGAEMEYPTLRCHMTPLIAQHRNLIPLLSRRVKVSEPSLYAGAGR